MIRLPKGAEPWRVQHRPHLFSKAGSKRQLGDSRLKAFPQQEQLSLPKEPKGALREDRSWRSPAAGHQHRQAGLKTEPITAGAPDGERDCRQHSLTQFPDFLVTGFQLLGNNKQRAG